MADRAPIAALSFILSELNESEETLRAKGIVADELLAIYNDYVDRLPELTSIAGTIAQILQQCDKVHVTKHRIKNPTHLLHKIIRKKKEYPNRHITHKNYLAYINDLAGIRALHVYKEDWATIGQHIQQHWQLKRWAHAYVKTSEAQRYTTIFAENQCKTSVHPAGYSAVHFVIQVKPGQQLYYAEIQLRTLLEEAWSEVDHDIRYPNHEHSALLDDLLLLLNNFTNNADETATIIRMLARELSNPSPTQKASLRECIRKLPLSEAEKQQLYVNIDKLT